MHDEEIDEEVTGEQAGGPLPMQEVERLVELLTESGVGEIQVRQGELEVTVRSRPEAPAPQPAPAWTAGPEPAPEPERPPEEPSERDGMHLVRSPVVGTFYRAPGPGEDVYVEVGDTVRAGQTVCIVEAMKLMNEIPAEVSGEVAEVLVENAQGVEYDEPLFYLRPEG